jgi:glycopeptide antibiotics resistance protein
MAPFAARLLATALPLALLATAAVTTAYVLARRRDASESGHARRVAVRTLLAVYPFGLAWWTIALANPNHDGTRHANLVPFREIARSLTDREPGYGLLNFWGNVVAFIPIGVLGLLAMRSSRRRGWLVALASGAGLSALLETCQYGVGRSGDIDDVILNALGVAIGVALACAARRGLPLEPVRTL